MSNRATKIPSIGNLADILKKRAQGKNGRAVILSFGAGVISRFGQLALAILLARQLGVANYGAFIYALGMATLIGQISTLGWPTLNNRMLPELKSKMDWGAITGLRNASDFVVLASSIIGAMILWVSVP